MFRRLIVSTMLACTASAVPSGLALAQDAQGNVEVSINFNMMIQLTPGDTAAQATALEQARRAMYEIVNRECGVLLEVIASTCQMTRLNIQSNTHRSHPMQEAANMGANAAYRITLKPRR